jgi:hypothetical protein
MNAITRHNYEEYFILYMDNELSEEQRRSVEAFVQLHPDLQDELDLLMQSKLQPDMSVSFEGKEELYFGNMNGISLSNYEEWLTLYIDNELKPEERTAVEQFAAQHPAVAGELYILQQTKLPAEEIVFPDKASLYRREEKTRRIAWWKMAAAAAILAGIVGTVIIATNKNKKDTGGFAEAGNKQEKTVPVKNDSQPEQRQTPVIPDQAPIVDANDTKKSDQQIVSTINKVKDQQQSPKKDIRQQLVKDDKQKIDFVKQVQQENNDVVVDNYERPSKRYYSEYEVMPKTLTNPSASSSNPAVTYTRLDPSRNQIAPVDEVIAAVDDQQDGKKNKLRGFLRKVTRTFEKTTNISATDDDDRLLVGGLAIRLK